MKYCDKNSVELLILRVPGIYGKNRLPIKRIMNREPLIEKSQSRTTNLIHVEDYIRIVIVTRNYSTKELKIINVSDGAAIKTTNIMKRFTML